LIGIRTGCLIAGILLLVLAVKAGPLLDGVMVRAIPDEKPDQNEKEEDDILNNKTKWRVILAGFIILGAVAVFSVISVFTLNHKINTLYNSVQNMEEILEESMEEPGSSVTEMNDTEQP